MTGPAVYAPQLSRAGVGVLAVAAGGAIANGYVLQPALVTIAHDLHAPGQLVPVVASAGLVGYLLGLALLVPLVDRIAARRLVVGQLLALAVALLLAAAAPVVEVLVGCFLLVGAATTVAAQCSALVGRLAEPTRRASRLATISTGISAGILLSRLVGGALTDLIGWRGTLLCSAAFAVLAAGAMRLVLPARSIAVVSSWSSTLRAAPAALRSLPTLRWRTAAGMCWFFAFNLVWVGLALTLSAPPYRLSPSAIGLYSLAGVLGLAVVRPAGRAVDRYGSRAVTTTGLIVATGAALALVPALGHPLATAIALAIFDAGCFAAQVANQAAVVAIDPDQSGALSAAYLTCYYAAGAVGSAASGTAALTGSWGIAAGVAALATAVALAVVSRAAEPVARRPL